MFLTSILSLYYHMFVWVISIEYFLTLITLSGLPKSGKQAALKGLQPKQPHAHQWQVNNVRGYETISLTLLPLSQWCPTAKTCLSYQEEANIAYPILVLTTKLWNNWGVKKGMVLQLNFFIKFCSFKISQTVLMKPRPSELKGKNTKMFQTRHEAI